MFFHTRRDEAAGALLPVRAVVVDPGFAQDLAPVAALEFLAAVAGILFRGQSAPWRDAPPLTMKINGLDLTSP
jgi:hypothetical protein